MMGCTACISDSHVLHQVIAPLLGHKLLVLIRCESVPVRKLSRVILENVRLMLILIPPHFHLHPLLSELRRDLAVHGQDIFQD